MSKNYKPSIMSSYNEIYMPYSQTVHTVIWTGSPFEIIPGFLIIMAGYAGVRYLLLKKKRG